MSHQAPESPKIAPPEANTVQQVVGTFLYYVRTAYTTMLVSLNSISVEKSNITEATAKSVTQILNYSVMHYEAITIYHAIGMILHIHSNAYFLSDP